MNFGFIYKCIALQFTLVDIVLATQFCSAKDNQCEHLDESCGKLSFQVNHNYMRLGNQMFLYASSYGISRLLRRHLQLPSTNYILTKLFSLPESVISQEVTEHSLVIRDADNGLTGTFNSQLLTQLKCGINYILKGDLQSYKYFELYRDELEHRFQCNQDVEKLASRAIEYFVNKDSSSKLPRNDVILIGIHVRRSDYLYPDYQDIGFTVASTDYIEMAMEFMRNKLRSKKLIFLFVGKDLQWSKRNFGHLDDVSFLPPQNTLLDFCVMRQMDHMIITHGTYGWWAGYLNDGFVVYAKDFAVKNSKLFKRVDPASYFPINWIGL